MTRLGAPLTQPLRVPALNAHLWFIVEEMDFVPRGRSKSVSVFYLLTIIPNIFFIERDQKI